jgi:hypothetical protein
LSYTRYGSQLYDGNNFIAAAGKRKFALRICGITWVHGGRETDALQPTLPSPCASYVKIKLYFYKSDPESSQVPEK